MAKNTGPSFNELATQFRHENFDPLYFFFGEEGFLMDELQALLIEHALPPEQHDFNFDLIYGSEAEASQVVNICQGYPVMAERRVVVVREFEQLENNRMFKSYAKQPNPHAVVLLLCTTKPNLSAHPYRALKQNATWSHFKPLYDNQIPGWIKSHVEGRGLRIDGRAVQMLAEYVGTDLQTAVSEIDKLETFIGERDAITTEDVLRASGQTREFNVFELQSAIGEGRHADAMRIAERLLQQANNPRGEAIMIVAILNGYIDKLWKLQPADVQRKSNRQLAGVIGVSPYFVSEYVQSAKRYTRGRLAQAYQALVAADYELKGGSQRGPMLILTLLLRQLMPNRQPAR